MARSARRTTGSILRGLVLALVPIGLAVVQGCGAQFPAAPAAANREPEGCRVSGRIVSTAWRDRGGRIERAIVSAWALPESKQVAEFSGEGEQSVFNAYGIYAVPAVILIDEQGRVVRRYHHAGKPELEADVRTLLSAPSKPIQLRTGR